MGSVPISIARRFTREFPIMNSDDDPQYWPNILGSIIPKVSNRQSINHIYIYISAMSAYIRIV